MAEMKQQQQSTAGAWAENRLYKLDEAGAFFSRSTKWVRRKLETGELEGFSLPNLVVSGKSINKFLRERRVCRRVS